MSAFRGTKMSVLVDKKECKACLLNDLTRLSLLILEKKAPASDRTRAVSFVLRTSLRMSAFKLKRRFFWWVKGKGK